MATAIDISLNLSAMAPKLAFEARLDTGPLIASCSEQNTTRLASFIQLTQQLLGRSNATSDVTTANKLLDNAFTLADGLQSIAVFPTLAAQPLADTLPQMQGLLTQARDAVKNVTASDFNDSLTLSLLKCSSTVHADLLVQAQGFLGKAVAQSQSRNCTNLPVNATPNPIRSVAPTFTVTVKAATTVGAQSASATSVVPVPTVAGLYGQGPSEKDNAAGSAPNGNAAAAVVMPDAKAGSASRLNALSPMCLLILLFTVLL
ncbi:unnamed protein product, partial [Mycena citricolor]